MPLVRPVSELRSKDHVETRVEIFAERSYATRLIPWLALVYISFGIVDRVSTGVAVWKFVALRFASVLVSWFLWRILRARVSYSIRNFLVIFPYTLVVQSIMVNFDLVISPYFAGLSLLIFVASLLMPMQAVPATIVFTTAVVPLAAWIPTRYPITSADGLMAISMTFGTLLVGVLNADQFTRDMRKRFKVEEVLARDLGKREREIRAKAAELVKRQTFESQFSPQVVTTVLKRGSTALEMQQRKVAVAVIDIVGSSARAKELDPRNYKEVIEEVFDVFSSACLRWDVTVDKFTGDGAQAFAGAPTTAHNDTYRAIMACRDTIQMLEGRATSLTRRWGEALQIRSAVCEGSALVGFLGRGSLKSYTAIGETVSFTHRLCAAGSPGMIATYSLLSHASPEVSSAGFVREFKAVSNLKGFGSEKFQVAFLTPLQQPELLADNGRCSHCGTPLVLDEEPNGLPKLTCPSCQSRSQALAS